MIEVPVDDTGKSALRPQGLRLKAVALRGQAVMPGSFQYVPCVRAVSGDPAVQADLLQRDPLFIIGQHHGQAGRAALQRLHLHDHRDLGNAFCDWLPDGMSVHSGTALVKEHVDDLGLPISNLGVVTAVWKISMCYGDQPALLAPAH